MCANENLQGISFSLKNATIHMVGSKELAMHSFGCGPHLSCPLSAGVLSSKAN